MTLENLEWHFLDPLLVVQELIFVLPEENLCKLTNGCHASSIDESPDQQRLVDMAHAHLAFEEINEFFVGHGRECIVVRFSLQRYPYKDRRLAQRCSAKLVRHE